MSTGGKEGSREVPPAELSPADRLRADRLAVMTRDALLRGDAVRSFDLHDTLIYGGHADRRLRKFPGIKGYGNMHAEFGAWFGPSVERSIRSQLGNVHEELYIEFIEYFGQYVSSASLRDRFTDFITSRPIDLKIRNGFSLKLQIYLEEPDKVAHSIEALVPFGGPTKGEVLQFPSIRGYASSTFRPMRSRNPMGYQKAAERFVQAGFFATAAEFDEWVGR